MANFARDSNYYKLTITFAVKLSNSENNVELHEIINFDNATLLLKNGESTVLRLPYCCLKKNSRINSTQYQELLLIV